MSDIDCEAWRMSELMISMEVFMKKKCNHRFQNNLSSFLRFNSCDHLSDSRKKMSTNVAHKKCLKSQIYGFIAVNKQKTCSEFQEGKKL